MADFTQLIRGILEGCILALLCDKEDYGYSIIERLKEFGFGELQESTVYPILTRLEKQKFLQVERKPSALGPPRKYYRISDTGLKELDSFVRLWSGTKAKVDEILKERLK